jgi:hypothetical protein
MSAIRQQHEVRGGFGSFPAGYTYGAAKRDISLVLRPLFEVRP